MEPAYQLCLVQNDPMSTLLVTPDGEAMYSIETPASSSPPPSTTSPNPAKASQIVHPSLSKSPLPPSPAPAPAQDAPTPTASQTTQTTTDSIPLIASLIATLSSAPKQSHTTTTITKREWRPFDGHVSTPVGEVHFTPQKSAVRFPLPGVEMRSGQWYEVALPPRLALDEGQAVVSESTWEFTANNTHYKWQILVQTPILVLASPAAVPVPLARYRRAKVGIVSRGRKASLEVFPAGAAVLDLIVVSFVGFMGRFVSG